MLYQKKISATLCAIIIATLVSTSIWATETPPFNVHDQSKLYNGPHCQDNFLVFDRNNF
jgi:hypothetical protein